jgi:hypothetical protein
MSYLIESPDGRERVHTDDASGYPGWRIIAEGEGARPKDHCDFDPQERRWKVVKAKKDRAEKAARARSMDRLELLEMIEALQARLDAAGIP